MAAKWPAQRPNRARRRPLLHRGGHDASAERLCAQEACVTKKERARLALPRLTTNYRRARRSDRRRDSPAILQSTAYWPIAVWSILATAGEGLLSGLPARPKAASSGDTPRSSLMATSAP